MENFVFNHPSHFSDMFMIFDSFFRNRTMTDVIIQCQGRNLFAHRLIISSGSEYFRSALVSIKVYSQMPIIIVTDISYEVMEYILDFIYRGQIIVPKEKVEAIRNAAAKLKIKGFENFIRKTLSHGQSFSFSNNQRLSSGNKISSGYSILNMNNDNRIASHLNEMDFKKRRTISPEHIQYNNNNNNNNSNNNNNNGRYNNGRSALEAALNGQYNSQAQFKKNINNMKRNYDVNGTLDLKMDKLPNDLRLNHQRAPSPEQQCDNFSLDDSCDEDDDNKKNENMENAMENAMKNNNNNNNNRPNYYQNGKLKVEYDSDDSNEANYTYEFDPKNFAHWENNNGNGNLKGEDDGDGDGDGDGEGEGDDDGEDEDYFEGISTSFPYQAALNGQQGPFDCIKCTKRFYDMNQLEIHFKRTHNLNKGNQCHICGKAYAWKSGLYKHKRHVHNIGGNGRHPTSNSENKSDNSLESPDQSQDRSTPIQQAPLALQQSNENLPEGAD